MFDLMVAWDEKSEDHLRDCKSWMSGNRSNSCWDISLRATNINLMVVLAEQSEDLQSQWELTSDHHEFLHINPWQQHVNVAVDIFHSEPKNEYQLNYMHREEKIQATLCGHSIGHWPNIQYVCTKWRFMAVCTALISRYCQHLSLCTGIKSTEWWEWHDSWFWWHRQWCAVLVIWHWLSLYHEVYSSKHTVIYSI